MSISHVFVLLFDVLLELLYIFEVDCYVNNDNVLY